MIKCFRLGSAVNYHRFVRILPLAFFGLYSILSLVLYKERLFADAGFYFFSITNFESLMIPHGRWATALLQLPLLAGIKLGAGLKQLAVIFSLSFPLFYAGIFCINKYILRARRAAWIPIGLLAFSSPTLFFWPVSELMQGLAALSVLIAFFDSDSRIGNSPLIRDVCGAAVCLLALSFHIGSFPVILFLMAFLRINSRIDLRTVWACLGPAIAYIIIKYALGLDDYEANRLAINESILDWAYLPRIFHNFVSGQIFVTLGLGLILQLGDRTKSVKFALGTAAASIALINLFFPAADKYFYYDNLYLIPLFIILLVFSSHALPNSRSLWKVFLKYKRTVVVVFFLVFLRIVIDAGDYSERQTLGRECCGRCIELGSRPIDGKTGNWSLGAETLVLSSLHGRTGIAWTAEARQQAGVRSDSDSLIIAPWIALSPKELNRKFYKFDFPE